MREKVCILHDEIRTHGGAEKVLIELARTFDAPIYAGRIVDDILPDDVKAHEVFTGKWADRAWNSRYLVKAIYQMQGWQRVPELYDYDVIINNKSAPGWFIPKDTQTTVWYVHSPARDRYDQFSRYGKTVSSRFLRQAMRIAYQPNTRYVDGWVCNSELIQRRLERYWGISRDEIQVVYPPVPIDTFQESAQPQRQRSGYVTIGRLNRHKHVDELITACNRLQAPLTIVGDGPDRDRLESLAGPTIEFTGFVDESRKRELLGQAQAFLFAGDNEDFGIAPIEAMAAGTPVIGIAEGFTRHQILDGRNGLCWKREDGIAPYIRRFEREGVQWSPRQISAWTSRFNVQSFRAGMRDAVEAAVEKSMVTPSWAEEKTREPVHSGLSQPTERAHTDGGARDAE